MFSGITRGQSPDPTGLGTVTIEQLVVSSNQYTASVKSLTASTGTFNELQYEEPLRRWALLEPALNLVLQQGGAQQAVRTACDSGKTAKIMSAYTTIRRGEPDSQRMIRRNLKGYKDEEVATGDGNPSQLNSEEMDRLKQAIWVAGYDELYGEPYRAVHDWILRNETTTAK